MRTLTIRNLPDDVHQALRVRAANNNRSTEAEVRTILEAAVKPKVRLGSVLAEFGQSIGLTDEDVELITSLRSKTPAEPINFDE